MLILIMIQINIPSVFTSSLMISFYFPGHVPRGPRGDARVQVAVGAANTPLDNPALLTIQGTAEVCHVILILISV